MISGGVVGEKAGKGTLTQQMFSAYNRVFSGGILGIKEKNQVVPSESLEREANKHKPAMASVINTVTQVCTEEECNIRGRENKEGALEEAVDLRTEEP